MTSNNITQYLADFEGVAALLEDFSNAEPQDRGEMVDLCIEALQFARKRNGFTTTYPLDSDLLPLEFDVMSKLDIGWLPYLQFIKHYAIQALSRAQKVRVTL